MIRATCPNGCSNVPPVPKPFTRRAEPITCRNCTAVYRIPDATPDGETVIGLLVAKPGEAPPAPVRAASVPLLRAQWLGIGVVANHALSAGVVGVMSVATGARPALGAAAPLATTGDPFAAAWAFGPAIALAHVAGGFIVGWRSPGETYREPALAGLLAGGAGALLLAGPHWPPIAWGAIGAAALAALGGAVGEHVQKR